MFYLPRPGDRVTVRTDAEPIPGEVICFHLGTVTVKADDGHILMAAKRKVSPVLSSRYRDASADVQSD